MRSVRRELGMPASVGGVPLPIWAASNPAAAPGIAVTNIRPVGDQMVASMRVADDRRAGLNAESNVE